MTRMAHQDVGSGSATVEFKAGTHKLKLWWYQWFGWALAAFKTDRKISILTRRGEPIIGLGVACMGAALTVVGKAIRCKKKP